MVRVQDAVKEYTVGGGVIRALDGLTFSIDEGEFTVVVGPSGAGKTTILNMLGGMDVLTGGEIFVGERAVHGLTPRELTLYRRDSVGFVFQFYNLMPNLTAQENVELAAEICKGSLSPAGILEKVGLRDRAKNFPAQLSGGEQQRVSIARAVAKNPQILLCDEPTGALDYDTGKRILKLLYDMCKEQRRTVIIVTHNTALKDMADRVIHIKNGAAARIEINEKPKDISEIEW
ncbi:MAG: ABC transporter ATP-binding protein [Clostridiales bacterium]|nr:ABC transporter ATP-binding protein [Clostridiales bacterium]